MSHSRRPATTDSAPGPAPPPNAWPPPPSDGKRERRSRPRLLQLATCGGKRQREGVGPAGQKEPRSLRRVVGTAGLLCYPNAQTACTWPSSHCSAPDNAATQHITSQHSTTPSPCGAAGGAAARPAQSPQSCGPRTHRRRSTAGAQSASPAASARWPAGGGWVGGAGVGGGGGRVSEAGGV